MLWEMRTGSRTAWGTLAVTVCLASAAADAAAGARTPAVAPEAASPSSARRAAAAPQATAPLEPPRSGGGPAHSEPRRRPRAVTLQWVGDIALSSRLGLPPEGLQRALAPVAATLRSATITAGNLEGTLSAGGSSKCATIGGECFAFQAPPSLAGSLRALGFGVLNQANNHSMDYGPAGRAETLGALRRAGIAVTGLPGQITVLRAHGTKVAFVGFAPYPYDANLLDIPAAQRLVRRAARLAPIVVAIIHAGAEGVSRLHTPRGSEFFLGEDRGDARAFAHAAIAAGAGIVLGSGPHVIRGVERWHGRLIAYSLGDFVGYHTLAGGGLLDDSGILRVTLGPRGRLLGARWISVVLRGGLPRLDSTHAAAKVVAAVSRQDFPGGHFAIGPSGLFHLGRVR